MKMKYVGKECMTIAKDEICTLIAIKRVRPDSPTAHFFPSGISLAFRKQNGHTLAWCDRNEWVKVKE